MRILKNIELDCLARACMVIDSTFSRQVMWYALYEPKKLVDVRIHPSDYTSAYSFATDYLVAKYLAKWKGLKPFTKLDTQKVAYLGWLAQESLNRETNELFESFCSGRTCAIGPTPAILHMATAKIAKVLGEFNLNRLMDECSWSTGATESIKWLDVSLHEKLTEPPSCSKRAEPYVRKALTADWQWAMANHDFNGSLGINTSDYGLFATVDKDAKTDRCIDKQPTLNMFFQKAGGNHIRRRLKRFGLNLDSQERNQLLARKALMLGLATLDLRSASDSLCTQVVKHLLPIDWFLFFDDIRTHSTRVPKGICGDKVDKIVKAEKFAAMGNGFAFELESLIFWALSTSVCEYLSLSTSNVAVFGDDIIVPSEASSLLIDVLAFCGFATNTEKSFTSGRFYESCGEHYFDGIEVTPCYQKNVLSKPEELIRASNRLRRWEVRILGPDIRLFKPIERRLIDQFQSMTSSYKGSGIPRIPLASEEDVGFLTNKSRLPGKADPNRGIRCLVYTGQARHNPIACKYHAVLYAHKLRFPNHQNACPQGGAYTAEREMRYTFTHKWISA